MGLVKQFLLIAVLGCSAVLWSSEEAAVKKVELKVTMVEKLQLVASKYQQT